jgi:hypothetical protein
LHLGLLHEDERFGSIFFGKHSGGCKSRNAAEYGKEQNEQVSPPENCDDILRADFLMHHSKALLWSFGRTARPQ